MLLKAKRTAASGWQMMRSAFSGFGMRNSRFDANASRVFSSDARTRVRCSGVRSFSFCLLALRSEKDLCQGWEGMDPLPTTFRPVSGKAATNGTRKQPARIVRNHKMLRQPRYSASKPPMTGPIAGPTIAPDNTQPMYLPRSPLVDYLLEDYPVAHGRGRYVLSIIFPKTTKSASIKQLITGDMV